MSPTWIQKGVYIMFMLDETVGYKLNKIFHRMQNRQNSFWYISPVPSWKNNNKKTKLRKK